MRLASGVEGRRHASVLSWDRAWPGMLRILDPADAELIPVEPPERVVDLLTLP